MFEFLGYLQWEYLIPVFIPLLQKNLLNKGPVQKILSFKRVTKTGEGYHAHCEGLLYSFTVSVVDTLKDQQVLNARIIRKRLNPGSVLLLLTSTQQAHDVYTTLMQYHDIMLTLR